MFRSTNSKASRLVTMRKQGCTGNSGLLFNGTKTYSSVANRHHDCDRRGSYKPYRFRIPAPATQKLSKANSKGENACADVHASRLGHIGLCTRHRPAIQVTFNTLEVVFTPHNRSQAETLLTYRNCRSTSVTYIGNHDIQAIRARWIEGGRYSRQAH